MRRQAHCRVTEIVTRDFEFTRSCLLADHLLEVAKADTAFADLYFQRARELLSMETSQTEDVARPAADREAARLVDPIRAAVEDRDWRQVRELIRSAVQLARTPDDPDPIAEIGERVGGFDELLVDPFSPGMNGLAGVPDRDLPALRDAAVKRLDVLRATDPAWADLYDGRREALRSLRFPFAAERPPSLADPFPREACERARKLGLVPYRVESTAEEIRARFHPSWRVAPGDPSGSTVRFSVTIPGDADEPLRENLAAFVNQVFLTSAGTRYIPSFVEEDLLIEDFGEPSPGSPARPSPLVAALGLPRRTGIARSALEKALRERGAAVVKDLGLDPRQHRVVCVPADVFTRLGARLGWGGQEIWTHFDGYMASSDGKLMPLGGGDVRFGGLHDLVAVSADYDSDRLLARFAIVQRRRFATW